MFFERVKGLAERVRRGGSVPGYEHTARGWLMLATGKTFHREFAWESPANAAWMDPGKGGKEPLALFDWLAWHASQLDSVERAWLRAVDALTTLPEMRAPNLGILDGYAGPQLGAWLRENFPAEALCTQPPVWGPGCLQALLGHPRFVRASQEAAQRYHDAQAWRGHER